MAKSVKARITPEVLRWVRERRIRLTIDYAADKLKVRPKRLKAWENGEVPPTFTQLKKIAALYRTNISIFYLPEPPQAYQPLTDYPVLFTSLAADEEQAYRLNANIVEAYDRRETLIELYDLLKEPLPQIIKLCVDENETPGQAAQKIIEFLNVDWTQLQQHNDVTSVLKFWKQTLEARDILVCQTAASSHLSITLETASGFCIALNPFPMIVLNSKANLHGRLSTLFQALVYIALGRSGIQTIGFKEDSALNSTEVFCRQVVSELLISEDTPLKAKPSQTDRCGFYADRLLNVTGEHFARTAFTAYYEDKITISELASIFSNCDTKYLFEIESVIFA